MIGNDIVDLALAKIQSNWRRKGFLDKIFTESEKKIILKSKNQEVEVWKLWSRKEAVYKIFNRLTQQNIFNPLQIECYHSSKICKEKYGIIICKEKTYYTRTIINADYIYSEAVCNTDDFSKIKFILRPKNIIKKNGVPSYIDKIDFIIKPISITHHGRFERIISI